MCAVKGVVRVEKWRVVDAAFRKAAVGVELGEITVELDEDGAGGLVVIDLSADGDQEDDVLDAFVEAYGPALLEAARQQGHPEAALRLLVRCGRHEWSGEQDTAGCTVVRVGPGRGGATREQRSDEASTPIMTRLRGDAVASLDLLVDAGVVRSRSLAVAWCVEQTLRVEAKRIEALRVPVAAVREARHAFDRDVTVATSRFGKYSDATSHVVRRALDEARERNRAFARPVHLLLALLRDRPPLTVAALQGLGVDVDALEARADAGATRAAAPQPQDVEMSHEVRKVIGPVSAEAARSLGQVVQASSVADVTHEMEPEHLLLGLLRVAEGKGSGISFLAEFVGDDALARTTAEIARLQKARGR